MNDVEKVMFKLILKKAVIIGLMSGLTYFVEHYPNNGR